MFVGLLEHVWCDVEDGLVEVVDRVEFFLGGRRRKWDLGMVFQRVGKRIHLVS